MKAININCPHCGKDFDVTGVLTPNLRAALCKALGTSSADRSVQEAALAELTEAHRLRELENEKHLSELRATILDLHRKAAASSQQRAGETFETEILQQLEAEFQEDVITRVGKGRNGGDIVHEVQDEHGRARGKILWEIKNTSTWSAKWLGKVRADALRCGAQLSVIVTTSLPKAIENFGLLEGVWVTNGLCHLGLALALRTQLLACARLETQLTDSARINELSRYITSPRFQEHVSTITAAVTALHNQVDREKQFFERHWAERKKLAHTISENISVLAGGVDGIFRPGPECIQESTRPEAATTRLLINRTVTERV